MYYCIKDGDLVYRFGNPEAYANTNGQRLFHNNHFPNLLKDEDEGKLMIFSNGAGQNQSTVYELDLPNPLFPTGPNLPEPKVAWSFSHADLYAAKVSGAVKLPNGNRLITEGDYGIWEVNDEGKVVWKFNAEGFFWRAYHYEKTAPEIESLGF